MAAAGTTIERNLEVTEQAPKLRYNIRTNDYVTDGEGVRHRTVRDWLGRGREHMGYWIGPDASGLLDLVDGSDYEQLLSAAREKMGSSFGPGHLDQFINGLDQKRLLDTQSTRTWLQQLREQEIARGFRPPVTGEWYPSDGTELAESVRELLENANDETKLEGTPRAIVSPHAGLVGSGSCAARAFATVARSTAPSTVIVLGPSHAYRADEIDICTLPFETPLGRLPSNTALAQELKSKLPPLRFNGLAGFREHSIEMQLPFIQFVAEEHWRATPTLAPITISRVLQEERLAPNQPQLQELDDLAQALAELLCQPATLLVVSGDLTHFGPNFGFEPYNDNFNEQIEAADLRALQTLTSLDVDGFLGQIKQLNWCGGPSFYVLMQIARILNWQPVLLDYLLRPETEWRQYEHVTSFAALAFMERSER